MVELKAMLERESAILAGSGESDELLQLIDEKTAKVQQLQELEQQREKLFFSIGMDNDPDGISHFLQQQIESPGLFPKWQQLLELGSQCREANRLNGTIIELGQLHLQQALCLLRGETTQSPHYDPQGRAKADSASRLLGQA